MTTDQVEDIYALSPMQAGMLFHTLLAGEQTVYLDQKVFELQGDLDTVAFEGAWQYLMARHAVLRTSFHWEGLEEPLQVAHGAADLPLEYQDWCHLSAEELKFALATFLQNDRARGVDLEQPPLMRLTLIRTDAAIWKFIWTTHHLLLDRWSATQVYKEFHIAYEAIRSGQRIPLSPLRPYRDYIRWMRRQGPEEAETYWRTRMTGFTSPTVLPIDREPGGLTSKGQFARQSVWLSEETSGALQSLARQNHLTLSTFVQGAWALLLSCYSGEEDVVFGATVSGRPTSLTGVEAMVGLFINTLPVRVRRNGSARLVDWLRQIQADMVEMREYEYSSLVQIQGWSDVPRGLPLFDTFIVVQNAQGAEGVTESQDTNVEAPGASERGKTLQIRATGSETSVDFPLYLVAAWDRRLLLRVHYDSHRYDEDAIARLLGHLRTLLEGMAANLEQPLSGLSMLSAPERHQLLVEWNATQAPSPQERCLHQRVEEQVLRTPEAIALVHAGQTLTYQQLNTQANQLAHLLQSHGVGPDTLVALCMTRGLDMVVSLLAILKAGAAYVALDPAYPQERLRYTLKDAGATLLLTQQHLLDVLPATDTPVLCLEQALPELAEQPTHNPTSSVLPANLAYVLYTSGSTGVPKGVAITHRSPVALVNWARGVFSSAELARVVFATSICFDLSIFELFVPLCAGGAVLLVENALAIGELEATSSPSLINTVPSAIAELLRQGAVPSSVVTVNLAGEALSSSLVDAIYAQTGVEKVYDLYGPSEDTTYSTWALRERGGRVTIGRPISNTQAYVLDGDGQPVAVGVSGELYLGGDGLARGYLHRPDLTAEKFVPDPFSVQPGSRLYRTGDLCRWLGDGNLAYLGRLDHQVKIRGFRIELGEIQSVLSQHPSVKEAVVVAGEDEPGDKRLVAYVVGVGREEESLSVSVLREHLLERLPAYMLPSALVLLEALPLTPNGKLDRKALPAPERQESGENYVAPRTGIEEGVAEIWGAVLGLEDVSVDANFFDLGGHSLLATQVISRVRSTFAVELALRALFEAPTVAELAGRIGLARGDAGALAPPLRAVSRAEGLPLSFSQQRLWFLDQFEPGSSVYNLPMALRLTGLLDVSALERSLQEVVRRHEALRTTFTMEEGVARQVIGEATPTLAIVDLAGMPAETREQEARRLVREEAQRPFDLAQGPLFRAVLVRIGAEEHALLLTMHHIVSDGWSMGVLRRELTLLYNAFRAGDPAPLSELPIQYADYAAWQRNWLQGEVLERQISYWQAHLAGAPALLELPTDRSRPSVQTFRGAVHRLELSAEITQGLKGLGRQEGTTLFMTLLAAFQTLLSHYSRQDQIVVGTPIANRTCSEVEGLIGFFVNTLAMRGDLSGDPSFVELLGRVREAALGAYAHQNLPFEKLVDALSPERSLSYPPLFQVMFILQNAGRSALDFQGLRLAWLGSETVTAKFDLQLALSEVNGQLRGALEYNTDLFDAETIARFASHFQNLLEAIVEDPEQKISRVPLLDAPERQRLLVAWNAKGGAFPQEPCLHIRFEEQATRTPDAVALVYEEQKLTYAQLNRRANQLAHALRARGVGPDVLVGLCLDRSLEMVVGVLGILKAGGAYVPLDPSYPAERLAYMLEDARLSLVVTRRREITSIPASQARPVCLDDSEILDSTSVQNLPSLNRPDHLAYIIYTSGSTGRPKGVQITHANVVRLMTATADWFHFEDRDVWTLFHSLSFDFSVWELWGPLLYGGKLVVVPFWVSRSPEAFLALLQSERVTVLNQTPSAFRPLLQILPPDTAEQALAIRYVIFGGEALEPASLQGWYELYGADDARLINMYGITETTVHVTFRTMRSEDTALGRGSLIGCPIPDGPLYLLGPGMQPVPIGVAGEIYVGGAGLARGYLGRPELTAERFVPDPFSRTPGARLYRSGDLGRYLANGELEYLGRADDQVKIRGFRIELGEIESVLSRHPSVRECVVLAREDVPGVKRLVAYVVGDMGALSASDLREKLLETLPEYMVPAAFVMLDALPLTPNGKIDRRALPAPDTARPDIEDSYTAPRTPVETSLAQIWSAILRIEKVGIHDNFFELGGDSILSIQIIARANAAGLQLTPRQVFQHQTIAGLAAVAGTEVLAAGEQGTIVGPVLLTPIQHWFFAQELTDPHHYNQARLLQLAPSVSASHVEQVVAALVDYHDALRLRFVRSGDGRWEQTNAAAEDNPYFTQVTLGTISSPDDRQAAFTRACSQWQASLDLNAGPLLRAVYFDMGQEQPARLLLVIHHLAVDGVSWRILLGDLGSGLEQLGRGETVTFAPKTTSYQRWAQRLEEYAGSERLQAERDYWLSLGVAEVASLPVDHPDGTNTSASERAVRVSLTEEETRALLSEVPSLYHTQINDVLLTGLAQALCAWTGERAALVNLEGHGREALFPDVDLSRTVGWFTSIYPVHLELASSGSVGESLKGVKEQLRRIPQRGVGYGVLRYLRSDQEAAESLARVPAAQVSFNYHGQVDAGPGRAGLIEPLRESAGTTHSPRSERSHLLDVIGQVVAGRLQVAWLYSDQIYERATIEGVAADFVAALRGIIAHCRTAEAGGFTPSDFPKARLSQLALDRLLAGMGPTGKTGVEDIYPLSPMQAGMLFRTVYVTEHAVYLDQHLHTLRGDLNRDAFQAAWRHIMERHTILRTSFHWEGLDEPLQVVHDRVDLPLNYHDLTDLPLTERQAALNALVKADRARGVDLARPPLMRVTLIRLEPTTYRLIWTIHHLLLDRWSTAQVMGEWNAVYQARCEGRTIALPPLRPYGDFIGWLQEQSPDRAETYWRRVLGGMESPTVLPIDKAPGGSGADLPVRTHVQLSEAVSATLQSLARRHRLTFGTLIQGAWALLLSRYSGEEDVLFGATVSGRPASLAGVESMVGMFINSLPVRVRASGSARLLDWLQGLQEEMLELREYEYSALVEIQNWSDLPRGAPLFESLVIVQNTPSGLVGAETGEKADAREETAEGRSVPSELRSEQPNRLQVRAAGAVSSVDFPLYLMTSAGRTVGLEISYDTHRYDARDITRLLEHLKTLLEGMAADPYRPLRSLPMLSETERHTVLIERNSVAAAYPQTCVHHLFEHQVERTPDAVAVGAAGQTLTYRELNARANRLAHYLRERGAGPNVLVGLCAERSLEMIVGVLGILKAGAAYVPLDPSYPRERLAQMLQDAGASLLLTQQALVAELPQHAGETICLDSDWERIQHQPAHNPNAGVGPDNLVYVIYTSGSTGKPKGTAVFHRGFSNLVHWFVAEFGFVASDRSLLLTSISFDLTQKNLYAALSVGGQLHLAPSGPYDPELIVSAIAACGATHLNCTPSHFYPLVADLNEAGAERLASLRYVYLGGEPIDLTQLASWLRHPRCHARLVNTYGPTECSDIAAYHILPRLGMESLDAELPTFPLGHAIPNVTLYVLDRAQGLVPDGVVGELYIGGAGVGYGYVGHPDWTAEKFLPDPFSSEPGARLYRTGDLVRWAESGELEFVGRVDHQVKIRGFRIELGEIESVLVQHAEVREAIVVAREDVSGDKRLVAYLVANGGLLTSEALRTYLQSRLPIYMVPSAFMVMEALPLSPNGKVDRKALPAPEAQEQGDNFVAPRTPIEEGICGIWSEVLRRPQIGIHDSFFDLGGHSLLATQVVSRIRNTFQVQLPLRALFETPTVAELAHQVLQSLRSGDQQTILPLVRVSREGMLPLSFAQQRLWFTYRFDPDNAAYNMVIALRIRGALDCEALQSALNAIAARHETLRTNFRDDRGEPEQVISEDSRVPLTVIGAPGETQEEREQAALALCREHSAGPFDLTHDRLIRGVLVRLEDEHHLLTLTMHHIVSDGWSNGLLIRELSALYEAFAAGRPSPLPELPLQYADFAVWQREWLQGAELERQTAYWKAQLTGAPPLLTLPTDRPRQMGGSMQGAFEQFTTPAEISGRLRELGQEERATQFMLLLAIFKVLLFSYSDQQDIVVGTDDAGRHHHLLEGIIGFFINHLVMRTDLSGNPTFRELVRRVREMCLGAYAHQDLPFDKLIETLRPDREAGYSPLFQALFVMDTTTPGTRFEKSLRVSGVNLGQSSPKYDIVLFVTDRPSGLMTSWGYRTDLFDAATIQGMAAAFDAVARAVVETPEITVGELKVMLRDLAAGRSADQMDQRRQANRNRLRSALSRPGQ